MSVSAEDSLKSLEGIRDWREQSEWIEIAVVFRQFSLAFEDLPKGDLQIPEPL